MALLPLAGWAIEPVNIAIMPRQLQFTYGDPIPTVEGDADETMVNVIGALPTGISLEKVAAALKYVPNGVATEPGSYEYYLVTKEGYNDPGTDLEGYTIGISGIGNLQVLKYELTQDMITIASTADLKYTGVKKEPAITVKRGLVELTEGTDYTVTYGDDTHDNTSAGANKGIIKISAVAESYYRGVATKEFTIAKRNLKSITIPALPEATYCGGAIVPVFDLTGVGKDDNETYPLVLNKDYTVTPTNNENVGTATVTVAVADGNFSFESTVTNAMKTATFTIKPVTITENNEFLLIGTTDKNFENVSHEQTIGSLKLKWTHPAVGDAAPVVQEFVLSDETFGLSYTNKDNVGTATVTATAKNTATNNFAGFISATYSILPASIEGAVITFEKNTTPEGPTETWATVTDSKFEYEGREIKPGTIAADGRLKVMLGGTELKLGKDYEIVANGYGNELKNVTPGTATDEEKPYVTIKGLGNYDKVNTDGDVITAKGLFTIVKRKLIYAAQPISTTLGAAPTGFNNINTIVESEDIGGKITYHVYATNATHTDTEGDEITGAALQALTVGGNYGYVATWESYNDVPLTAEAIAALGEDDHYDTAEQIAARANYDMDPATNIQYTIGAITVGNATIVIVPNDKTQKYASAAKALDYTVYNGTVAEENELVGFTFDTAPVLKRQPGDNVKYDGDNVIGYEIYVENQSGTGAVAKAGYDIRFETGTYTITPFEITVKANNQKIVYGSQPNRNTTITDMVRTVNASGVEVEGTELTVTYTPAMTGDGLIDRATLNLKIELAEDYDGTVKNHEGALIPSINNGNFKATCIPGDLEVVTGANIDIVRLDVTEYKGETPVAKKLEQYDGEDNVLVTIKANATAIDAFKIMEANRWYAIVLPFATTVREVSKAFGYAVVDILDKDNASTTDAYFKLWLGEIAANEPFILKIDQTRNLNTNPVEFTADEIEYSAEPSVSAAEGKVKFIGVYDGKKGFTGHEYIFALGTGKISGTTSSSYIPPMSAYIHMDDQMDGMNNARIFIEEPDGSTTAINAAELADGNVMSAQGWYTIDGIKLNAAPTEKGVYIQNGKKVVLK